MSNECLLPAQPEFPLAAGSRFTLAFNHFQSVNSNPATLIKAQIAAIHVRISILRVIEAICTLSACMSRQRMSLSRRLSSSR